MMIRKVMPVCVCLSLVLGVLTLPGVNAVPGFVVEQYLTLTNTISNDFNISKLSASAHQVVDGEPAANWYQAAGDSYLYWGNATAAADTTATFGIGDARFALSDPVAPLSDYYIVSATAWWALAYTDATSGYQTLAATTLGSTGIWSSGNLGFGYTAPGTMTPLYEQMHESSYLEGWWEIQAGVPTPLRPATGTQWWDNATNIIADRPWSLEEIQNMYVVVSLRLDATVFTKTPNPGTGGTRTYSLVLCGLSVAIAPVAYTPPATPYGSFILRPDADLDSHNMDFLPVDAEGIWDTLNEVNPHGDGTTSYAYANWSLGNGVVLSFTDPPSWADGNRRYTVEAWIVAMETVLTTKAVITFAIYGGDGGAVGGVWTTRDSWSNHTVMCAVNPDTNESWRLSELKDITAALLPWWLTLIGDTGECRITQVALLCTPITPISTSPDFSGILHWLGQGGGIISLFGIIGFVGMIVVPVMAVHSAREGYDTYFGAALTAFVLWVLCFGFFLVGVFAGS